MIDCNKILPPLAGCVMAVVAPIAAKAAKVKRELYRRKMAFARGGVGGKLRPSP